MEKKTSRAISMALLAATEGKQEGIVNLLLDQGGDVNCTKVSGMTPLMLASYSQYAKGVKLPINACADVNKADNGGNTALMLAIQTGNACLIKLLLNQEVM